jgi:hypothetical protein
VTVKVSEQLAAGAACSVTVAREKIVRICLGEDGIKPIATGIANRQLG